MAETPQRTSTPAVEAKSAPAPASASASASASTAQPVAEETAPSTTPTMVATQVPGVQIDPNSFVVLHSRLGRKMEALPKINPDDPAEQIKYHVPEAFPRGEVISIDDIDATAKAAGYENNLHRLLSLGAIGRPDHPEAANAIQSLAIQRESEAKARR